MQSNTLMKNHDSHDHHEKHNSSGDHSSHLDHIKSYRNKFFISLILGIPVLIMSPIMGVTLPFQFSFAGSNWIVLILSTALYFYGGSPFIKGAKEELKNRNPAMMTLVTLGISVAYFYSVYAFINNNIIKNAVHIMDFFWELASLIIIMLLGHWIEMRAISNAGSALDSLAQLLPTMANRLNNEGKIESVLLSHIENGDFLLVHPGEIIPTDGIIKEGSSSVNESMLTGESKNVEKNENSKVIGGSINGSGSITIEVTGTGETGYLSQVMKLVETAQKEKSKAENLSDSVAKILFYVAVVVGIFAFIVWISVSKDINIALTRMVTVLVIACPHALGLAIPLVTARSTSLGAQNGLLVKNRNALEFSKKIDVIMMDKTGTLTEGNFAVNYFKSFSSNFTDEKMLGIMGALEQGSSHPLAVGILDEIKKLNIEIPKAVNIRNIAGVGLSAEMNNQNIKIVSVGYLEKNNIQYDEKQFLDLSSLGNSVSFLLINEENTGIVAQGDQIKDQSSHLIAELKRLGIEPVMLTGDNKFSAQVVADKLGITSVFAGLLPEDKEKIIKEYMDKGKTVMMVGDGVNDAPSLARATVGVAIGAGTDVAIDSADVILVKSNPSDILHFLSLAKNTSRKMIQNLWWGAGYNILAIPLAAGVLAPIGFVLSPALGAVLMSLSTVIVAINAILLKI